MTAPAPATAPVSAARVAVGAAAIGIVAYAYVEGGPTPPFDYFGYFTNLTSVLASVVLIVAGALGLRGAPAPARLSLARAVSVACMIVVGVVYNTLVPGTGSAPPWVSAALHAVLPVLLLLDWALVGDRPALPWRRLWVVLPYPVVWLAVVLVRGATDGWVPYGFLLPERGPVSLALHIVGLLAVLLAAGAAVWALSRLPGARADEARATDA